MSVSWWLLGPWAGPAPLHCPGLAGQQQAEARGDPGCSTGLGICLASVGEGDGAQPDCKGTGPELWVPQAPTWEFTFRDSLHPWGRQIRAQLLAVATKAWPPPGPAGGAACLWVLRGWGLGHPVVPGTTASRCHQVPCAKAPPPWVHLGFMHRPSWKDPSESGPAPCAT